VLASIARSLAYTFLPGRLPAAALVKQGKVVINKTVRLIGKALLLERTLNSSALPKLANAVTVATARYYAHPLNE
jgi:hypothetical protein